MSVWLDGEGPYDLEDVVEDHIGLLTLEDIDLMVGDLETAGVHVAWLHGGRGIMTVKVAE